MQVIITDENRAEVINEGTIKLSKPYLKRPIIEVDIESETQKYSLRNDGIFRLVKSNHIRLDPVSDEAKSLFGECLSGKEFSQHALNQESVSEEADFIESWQAYKNLDFQTVHHLQPGKSYKAIDIETTGFNQENGDRIIQFAIVDVTELMITGQQVEFDSLACFVNPLKPIPSQATRINGITYEMVRETQPFREYAQAIVEYIGDSILIGHNIIDFDMHFLNYELVRAGQKPLLNPLFDTLELAEKMQLQDEGDVSDYRLQTLAEKYVPDDVRYFKAVELGRAYHDAYYDAFVSAHLAWYLANHPKNQEKSSAEKGLVNTQQTANKTSSPLEEKPHRKPEGVFDTKGIKWYGVGIVLVVILLFFIVG